MSMVPILAAVAVLGLVPVLLRRPDWAVFLMALILGLNLNHVLAVVHGIGIGSLALFAGMVGLAVAYPVVHGDRPVGVSRYAIALTIWLLAVLNSAVWSWAPKSPVDYLQDFLPNILLAVALFLLITDRARLVHALAGLASAALLLAALTVTQAAFGLQDQGFLGLARVAMGNIVEDVDSLRPTGPLEDPNYYAQMLLPGLGLWLGVTIAARSQVLRLVAGLAVLVVTAAVLLTSSRGGVVALGLMVLVWLVRERRLGVMVLLMPPLLATLLLMPGYGQRLVTTASSAIAALSGEDVNEASVSGRLAEMGAAAQAFAEHPGAGLGYGTFQDFYQAQSVRLDLKLRSADRSAHSLYLEAAAEQGLPGLLALIAMIALAFRAAFLARAAALATDDPRLRAMLDGLIAGAIGLFAAALFLHDAYGQNVWMVLTLLFAAERATLFIPNSVSPNRRPLHAG
jgi:O-antigen ligase